jgi:hypothetical protein
VSETPQDPVDDSVAIVCDVLRERVATQLAQVDGLDTKASALLGFAGVLLGLLFTNTDLTSHWNGWLTAAVVLVVLSAVALAASLWVRSWAVKPAATDLRLVWGGRPHHDTERVLAAAFEAAWYHNNQQARVKALCIRGGTSLLAAAIVVAALGLMTARSHVHPVSAAGQPSSATATSSVDAR